MKKFDDLFVFVAVVDRQSFVAAALFGNKHVSFFRFDIEGRRKYLFYLCPVFRAIHFLTFDKATS